MLQRELKQNKMFRSPRQEAVIALVKTADVLQRYFAEAIEPYGITLQQYNVLRILRGAGGAGLPTLAIAERMIEEAPGMTRMIDRLEAKNLVSRKRSASDRREVRCLLTPEGMRLLRRLDSPVDQAEDKAILGLSNKEVVLLIDLLEKIRIVHHETSDV